MDICGRTLQARRRQDIAGETLLKSLELIAHGEMIVHPQLMSSYETAHTNGQATHSLNDTAAYTPASEQPALTRHSQSRSSLAEVKLEDVNEGQGRKPHRATARSFMPASTTSREVSNHGCACEVETRAIAIATSEAYPIVSAAACRCDRLWQGSVSQSLVATGRRGWRRRHRADQRRAPECPRAQIHAATPTRAP